MATTTTLGYDDLPALLTRLTGDEKHDRSSLSTLDVLWVLYDRVLGAERPLPALEGARPGGVLRRARGEGHRPRRGARRLRRASTRRSATTRTASSRRASRSRAARSATGCRSRSAPRLPAAASAASSATASSTRARTGRRCSARAGSGSARSPRSWSTTTPSTHGWPGGVERRFVLEGWTRCASTGATTTRSRQRCGPTRRATRPRCVVAEVEPR